MPEYRKPTPEMFLACDDAIGRGAKATTFVDRDGTPLEIVIRRDTWVTIDKLFIGTDAAGGMACLYNYSDDPPPGAMR